MKQIFSVCLGTFMFVIQVSAAGWNVRDFGTLPAGERIAFGYEIDERTYSGYYDGIASIRVSLQSDNRYEVVFVPRRGLKGEKLKNLLDNSFSQPDSLNRVTYQPSNGHYLFNFEYHVNKGVDHEIYFSYICDSAADAQYVIESLKSKILKIYRYAFFTKIRCIETLCKKESNY